MPSNMDLSFHAPAAALGGVDVVVGAAGSSSGMNANHNGNGMFSRLHLVGNPDWMSSFSSSQQVAAARPILAPPAPVASAPPRALPAPAAIDAPAPAAKGFFSMFYRAPTSSPAAGEVSAVSRTAGAAGGVQMPAPPKSLDAFDSPPQRALPVDAQLSLDHFARSGVVEATMPAVRAREPPRPLALGSDTWNALSSVPLPPKTTTMVSAAGKHVLSPPAAVDGFATRAPKPLWSDLSFTSRFRSSAPTLDAFRNVAAPTPVTSSPVETALPQPLLTTSSATAAPVPPKPLTTSPLRDTAMVSSVDVVASSQRRAHPLVPIGEEATAPVTPRLRSAPEATPAPAHARVMAAPVPALCAVGEHDGAAAVQTRNSAGSPVLADFVKSIAEPADQQEQREEALAAANVRNFLSTIFSRDEDAESTTAATNSKTDAFNALELAINRSGAPAKPATQPLSYSTFASSPLFMDNNDEDSEEGLERLRRVVSIVMQSAKSHDGSSSQPASQTQRRNGGGAAAATAAPVSSSPLPGRYTEFSATYHTPNTGSSNNVADSEWIQYARF